LEFAAAARASGGGVVCGATFRLLRFSGITAGTMILAGDVGGTNTRLGIFDPNLKLSRAQAVRNAGRGSLEEIVAEFLEASPRVEIDRACFGVAGPVAAGKVKPTNLPWQLEEALLAETLKIPRVLLINDLVAHAEGIELLDPGQLIELCRGEMAPRGNRAIIAAGTGLGEAGLVFDEHLNGYRAFASEGGHVDFSPRGEVQIALMRYIERAQGIATWERVLSGPGLRHIYDFFCSEEQLGKAAALPMAEPAPSDISAAGMVNSNPAAAAAVDLFISLYGSEAGNLALKLLASGGVYVGGGSRRI
jgi:glucokinase